MKKISKLIGYFVAVTIFSSLMIFNVHFGTTDVEAFTIPEAEADIIITCGSRNMDCFTFDDGEIRIEIPGGVEDIQIE